MANLNTTRRSSWVLQTCGENCPHYYHGKYTGRDLCYKKNGTTDDGQAVIIGSECLYQIKVRAPKQPTEPQIMVPVKRVSREYAQELEELRRTSRPVSYLMVLADQMDEAVFLENKRNRRKRHK